MRNPLQSERHGGKTIQAPNLQFDWLQHGFGLRDYVPPRELVTARQIHSARILEACGQGGEIGEGDAIISSAPGVAAGIRTADCVPILMADPVTRTIACVHAGWRGTAANIVAATVRELEKRGAEAGNLCVAIGPAIGVCCYEVGADVAVQFRAWGAADSQRNIDLAEINRLQVRETGVVNVWKSGECTRCDSARFHSFRRDGERAGRMIAFAAIRAD